jgi:hypothetical protein
MFEFELAFFSNSELFEFLQVRDVQGFEVWENPSLIITILKCFYVSYVKQKITNARRQKKKKMFRLHEGIILVKKSAPGPAKPFAGAEGWKRSSKL